MTAPRSLLNGIRVVEFATVLAGPAVGQFLAELGATVIKIEPPSGDATRRWCLPSEAQHQQEEDNQPASAYFNCVNWGKYTVSLNLNAEQDRCVFTDLIAEADILLTNLLPHSLEKLQLRYQDLAEDYPRLIYGQISGYGPTADTAGYDAVIQAEAGLMSLNGEPTGLPTKVPIPLMDLLAAEHLRSGVLAALFHRSRTGQGTYVHSSLLKAGISALLNMGSSFLKTGQQPRRLGSDHPQIAPYGHVFRTAGNELLLLAVGTDGQFRRLCDVLGQPQLATETRFATNAERVSNRDALNALLQEHIQKMELKPLLSELRKCKIPAGAIHGLQEVAELAEGYDMLLRAKSGEPLAFRHLAFDAGFAPALPLRRPPAFDQDRKLIVHKNRGSWPAASS